MKATAQPLAALPPPVSEQSSVRPREASSLTSTSLTATSLIATPASPAERGTRLAEKLAAARALQRRLPIDHRHGQLLAIAILRRDEALLDELLKPLAKNRRL